MEPDCVSSSASSYHSTRLSVVAASLCAGNVSFPFTWKLQEATVETLVVQVTECVLPTLKQ